MRIVEISNQEFDEFAKFHPLNSMYQNSKYALVMSSFGFNYDFIGFVDEKNVIKAAAMILTKTLTGKLKYGYSPRGFLINYFDTALLKDFVFQLASYYDQKGFLLIKFDPEIIIGQASNNGEITYNGNVKLIDDLKNINLKRRKPLKEFDLISPNYNAYINLKEFDLNKINGYHRKRIKRCISKGMTLEEVDIKNIDKFYEFVKNKTDKSINYYRNLYNLYKKDNLVELVMVNLDFEKFLTNAQAKIGIETNINQELSSKLQIKYNKKVMNKKMLSDKKIQSINNEIVYATQGLKNIKNTYVAGALLIKQQNRISVIISGFDDEYKQLCPNHYLYYALIEKYKEEFKYLDIGGVSSINEEDQEYHSLNSFKKKFKPSIYEFIGEFDLICNEHTFNRMIKTSFIEEEFEKFKY